MKHHAIAAANEIIRLGRRDDVLVSNLTLHQFIYLLQGHGLATSGENLLDEQPLALQYGPIYRTVYYAFRGYGAGPILAEEAFPFDDEHSPEWMSTDDVRGWQILEAVWDCYKDMPLRRMFRMTIQTGGPWHAAYRQGRSLPIAEASMLEYFSEGAQA